MSNHTARAVKLDRLWANANSDLVGSKLDRLCETVCSERPVFFCHYNICLILRVVGWRGLIERCLSKAPQFISSFAQALASRSITLFNLSSTHLSVLISYGNLVFLLLSSCGCRFCNLYFVIRPSVLSFCNPLVHSMSHKSSSISFLLFSLFNYFLYLELGFWFAKCRLKFFAFDSLE